MPDVDLREVEEKCRKGGEFIGKLKEKYRKDPTKFKDVVLKEYGEAYSDRRSTISSIIALVSIIHGLIATIVATRIWILILPILLLTAGIIACIFAYRKLRKRINNIRFILYRDPLVDEFDWVVYTGLATVIIGIAVAIIYLLLG